MLPFRFAGVQVIPIENGVEGQEIGALGLPAPERPQGKHHNVTLAARNIQHQRPIREGLAAGDGPGEQHVTLFGRKLHYYARAHWFHESELAREPAHFGGFIGLRALRRLGSFARIQWRKLQWHCIGRDILTDASATTSESAEASTAGIEDWILIEIDRQIFACRIRIDRAFWIVQNSAQDRSAREKLRGMLHRDAVPARP